jgi:hypothetical protein
MACVFRRGYEGGPVDDGRGALWKKLLASSQTTNALRSRVQVGPNEPHF